MLLSNLYISDQLREKIKNKLNLGKRVFMFNLKRREHQYMIVDKTDCLHSSIKYKLRDLNTNLEYIVSLAQSVEIVEENVEPKTCHSLQPNIASDSWCNGNCTPTTCPSPVCVCETPTPTPAPKPSPAPKPTLAPCNNFSNNQSTCIINSCPTSTNLFAMADPSKNTPPSSSNKCSYDTSTNECCCIDGQSANIGKGICPKSSGDFIIGGWAMLDGKCPYDYLPVSDSSPVNTIVAGLFQPELLGVQNLFQESSDGALPAAAAWANCEGMKAFIQQWNSYKNVWFNVGGAGLGKPLDKLCYTNTNNMITGKFNNKQYDTYNNEYISKIITSINGICYDMEGCIPACNIGSNGGCLPPDPPPYDPAAITNNNQQFAKTISSIKNNITEIKAWLKTNQITRSFNFVYCPPGDISTKAPDAVIKYSKYKDIFTYICPMLYWGEWTYGDPPPRYCAKYKTLIDGKTSCAGQWQSPTETLAKTWIEEIKLWLEDWENPDLGGWPPEKIIITYQELAFEPGGWCTPAGKKAFLTGLHTLITSKNYAGVLGWPTNSVAPGTTGEMWISNLNNIIGKSQEKIDTC